MEKEIELPEDLEIIAIEDIPPLPTYTCNRCGHTWIPRTLKPKYCAKCHSPYWNKPRMRKQK